MNPLRKESGAKSSYSISHFDSAFWPLFGASACIAAFDLFLFIMAVATDRKELLAIPAIVVMLSRWLLVGFSAFVKRSFGILMLGAYLISFLVFLSNDVQTDSGL